MDLMSDALYRLRGIRIGAVVAVALAAGFLVWLLAVRDGGSSSEPASTGSPKGPVEASESDLGAVQDQVGHPVYWAGQRAGTKLEVTETRDGRVFVRYLGASDRIGDPKPGFLTVGTYPLKNAYRALQTVSKRPGAIVRSAPSDGLVVTNEDAPTSVYLAYPEQNLQIEVYSPDAQQALQLATSGEVQPAG